MVSPLEFFRWLNETPLSVYLRDSDYPFFVIETIHLLALGFSVGTILWVDLRLVGLSLKRERVSDVVRQFERSAVVGFVVMFISGFLLLLAEPLKAYITTAFRIKMVMLVFAGLNVLYFHSKVYPAVADWDGAVALPWRARMVGIVSMMLWLAIIICGRWTAYFSVPGG
jgi:uncharacterized membrane protein